MMNGTAGDVNNDQQKPSDKNRAKVFLRLMAFGTGQKCTHGGGAEGDRLLRPRQMFHNSPG